MDKLFDRLPEIITAAAQSQLGILALLAVALSVLAFVFFAKASEKARVGIFVMLFAGVVAFGAAMFLASKRDATTSAMPAELSTEAKAILHAAAADPSGYVLYEKFGAGVDLHSNEVSFLTDKADHRAVAAWEAALEQLVQQGLLAMRDDAGEVYEITQRGYDAEKRLGPATTGR